MKYLALLPLLLCACSGRSYNGTTHADWKANHPYAKQDWVLTIEGQEGAIYSYVDAVPSISYNGAAEGKPQYSTAVTTYTLNVDAAGVIVESSVEQ